MEIIVDFHRVFDALVTKAYIIFIICIILFAGSVIFIDSNAPDTYAATSTVYSASYVSYRESADGRYAIFLYSDIVRSRKVAERAASLIGTDIEPEQIMGMVSSSFSEYYTMMVVKAVSQNPELAVSVANAVAAAFAQEIVNITALEGVKVLDTAKYAVFNSSGSRSSLQIRAIVTLSGVIFTMFAIVTFTVFDRRAAFPQDVTLNGEIELMGVLPAKDI